MHFEYEFEHIRNGEVIDTFRQKNLIPIQGYNHMLDVTCHGGTQVSTWYVAIYEGNFTPSSTDTAASLPAAAVECTAYAEATRPTWNEGAVSGGVVTNVDNKAEFTMNATKTLYGCWLTSVSGKSSTSGVALSVVRFSTPKTCESGDVFRVTAPVTLTAS